MKLMTDVLHEGDLLRVRTVAVGPAPESGRSWLTLITHERRKAGRDYGRPDRAAHVWQLADGLLFAGRLSIAVGALGAVVAGADEVIATCPHQRFRVLRHRYPAVLIGWDGGPATGQERR